MVPPLESPFSLNDYRLRCEHAKQYHEQPPWPGTRHEWWEFIQVFGSESWMTTQTSFRDKMLPCIALSLDEQAGFVRTLREHPQFVSDILDYMQQELKNRKVRDQVSRPTSPTQAPVNAHNHPAAPAQGPLAQRGQEAPLAGKGQGGQAGVTR